MTLADLLRDLGTFARFKDLEVRLTTTGQKTSIGGIARRKRKKGEDPTTVLVMHGELGEPIEGLPEHLYFDLSTILSLSNKGSIKSAATSREPVHNRLMMNVEMEEGMIRLNCSDVPEVIDCYAPVPPVKQEVVKASRISGTLEHGTADVLKYWHKKLFDQFGHEKGAYWGAQSIGGDIVLMNRHVTLPFLRGAVSEHNYKHAGHLGTDLASLLAPLPNTREFEVAVVRTMCNVRFDSGQVKYDYYLLHSKNM